MPWMPWVSPAFQANIDLSTSEIWIWSNWPQPGYITITGFGAFNPNVDNIFHLAVNNDMTPFQNAVSLFRDRHFDTRADPEPPSSDKCSTFVPYPLGKGVVKTRPLPIPLRSFVAFRIFNFRIALLVNARSARGTVRSAVLMGWKSERNCPFLLFLSYRKKLSKQ